MQQLQGDDRHDGGLPDHRLGAPLAHRPLVVDGVEEVGRARRPVLARARHPGAGAGHPAHRVAEGRGVGQAGRDDVPWRHRPPAYRHRVGAVQAQQVQGAQHVDELLAEAVLEGDPARIDRSRHQEHLLVLHVHALQRTDAGREVEELGLGEGRRGEPAAVALVDDGRVEALLDGRPDREGRGEAVPCHDQVAAVADGDLVDLAEQVVRGVAGQHVGQPRLDPHAAQGQLTPLDPGVVLGELKLAQQHAGLLVGTLRVGRGQRHRHVQVGHSGASRGLEDRHDEARVAGVEHRRGAGGREQRRDRGGVPCVDGGVLDRVPGAFGGQPGPGGVEVGDDDLREAARSQQRGSRSTDAAGAEHEHLHGGVILLLSTFR